MIASIRIGEGRKGSKEVEKRRGGSNNSKKLEKASKEKREGEGNASKEVVKERGLGEVEHLKVSRKRRE